MYDCEFVADLHLLHRLLVSRLLLFLRQKTCFVRHRNIYLHTHEHANACEKKEKLQHLLRRKKDNRVPDSSEDTNYCAIGKKCS